MQELTLQVARKTTKVYLVANKYKQPLSGTKVRVPEFGL